MRKIFAYSLIALGVTAAAPAMAQGVYIGPGGVGVDTGIHRHHHWDRDNDRDRGYYEGRSAYRDGYRDDRYDRHY